MTVKEGFKIAENFKECPWIPDEGDLDILLQHLLEDEEKMKKLLNALNQLSNDIR